MLSLIVPSILYIYYKNPYFNLSSCFTKIPLVLGIGNAMYYIFSGLSYIILPLSIGVPFFLLWPILRRVIGIIQDKSISIFSSINTIVLFVGILCFIFSGLYDLKSQSIYYTITGFIFGLIGVIGITIRWYYTPLLKINKPLLTNNSYNKRERFSNKNKDNNKDNNKDIIYNSCVALLYSTFILFLCLLFLSICLYLIPDEHINLLKELGFPDKILNKYDLSFNSFIKSFVIFFIFSGLGNIGFTIGNLLLPYNIFTSIFYLNILISSIIGYIRLKESIDYYKIAGNIIILLGINNTIIHSTYKYW